MVNKVFQRRARILANKAAGRFGHCKLEDPEISHAALPGQCVDIQITSGLDPLLRRPFGIHAAGRGTIDILYEIVGRGTLFLSQKRPGEYVDVIGPFGTGFRLPPSAFRLPAVLIAGGMGVAPLLFLAEKLAEGKRQKTKGKSTVLIGAQTKAGILCAAEFRKYGCEVHLATDDGSAGYRGYVSGLLERHLAKIDYRPPVLYACGPQPMLREVSRIAAGRGLPLQVSLEAHMSCGIGACLGCVVETTAGFKRVCKEGPVFDAGEIVWGEA